MSFNKITEFENVIANYFGAPYAVAVDCCTHAIELCLRLQHIKKTSCPKRTYISVPMTLEKLNLDWQWSEEAWKEYYYLTGTNIVDAAVLWKEDSYISGTHMCLSFQFHKHLGLGRGGMILLDNKTDRDQLVRMCYDGRDRDILWAEQQIYTMGYHYYMIPETAIYGIEKFNVVKDIQPKIISYNDYPDLSTLPVFNK
jgi:dTDP-4-amino-4,6-dideoxygalactose transaminase